MVSPVLSLSPTSAAESEGDVLLIGASASPEGPVIVGDDAPAQVIDALRAIGATMSVDELIRLPLSSAAAPTIAVVGLASAAPDANALRRAAGAATRQLRGIERLVIGLPYRDEAEAVALLEGAAIGAYEFTGYRTKQETSSASVREIVLPRTSGVDEAVLSRAQATADSVRLVRDLVNTPPNDLTPEVLAASAADEVERAAVDGAPISCRILEAADLVEEEFTGILAVGQGSANPPRLVIVEYRPEGASAHLALVGKGITFDTGGLSLKPASSMVGMKYDMTGAATVLAATVAAARLGVATQITAFLCIAENMIGSGATRPNDVIRIKGGTTVEVLNTDAEGRLVLADGLRAASALHPDAIVDVATLTGAARNAFGFRTVPVIGDAGLSDRVVGAADRIGEDFWRLPLGDEWRPQLKSDVADLANVKMGSAIGGMFTAAAFLQEFVGRVSEDDDAARIPWAHLDIAGPANNEGTAYGYTDKGTTGVAVRTLVALAADLAEGE